MLIKAASELSSGLPKTLNAFVLLNRSPSQYAVRILAVGDLGFSGRIRKTYETTHNYQDAFCEVAPLLRSADQVFCNLETPLLEDQIAQMFAGKSESIFAVKQAGFNIINLANNHMLDYGEEGLSNTIQLVNGIGAHAVGAGYTQSEAKSLFIDQINGLRVGWLGCGRTLVDQSDNSVFYWEYDEDEILDAVHDARPKVDFLILSIHTGLMYLDYPKPDTKAFAEKLLESGVNIILMHHAHVVQGVQVHENGSICCYNLGNFLLDWKEGNVPSLDVEEQQKESAIFVFDIDKSGCVSAFALPVYFDDDFFVHWAVGDRGEKIINRLKKISEDLQGDYQDLFEQQRAERNAGSILKVIAFHLKRGNFSYIFNQISHLRYEHIKMFTRYFFQRLR